MFLFGKGDWKTFNEGIEREWLLTNGIGGFASSTIIGANTRRYHGLLTATLNPPVKRHLILSKMDETITIDGVDYELSANQTIDHSSQGYKHLQSVEIDKTVSFIYNVQDVIIEKKLSFVYGKNTIVIMYKIINGISPSLFKIYPLINFRDYHGNLHKGEVGFNIISNNNKVEISPANKNAKINLNSSEGSFRSFENTWFYNMDYLIERERGLDSVEDHFMPGVFEILLEPEKEKIFTVVCSTEDVADLDASKVIENEEERLNKLVKSAGYKNEFINQLVIAADKFIVHRNSTNAKTIIAGYPWFTDWGRDTMIALPGLTLVTKRYDDAKEILLSFTKYIKKGLVPNMFPDEGQEPLYNTVDASLWFFEAVFKFLKYTNEYSFVKDNIYVKMKEIIEFYKNGTDFDIKMDVDGLINAGNKDVQLTWMDAKIGNFVVTPRHGKAVEINALWYNALKIMNILARKFGEDPAEYQKLAIKVKKSFEKFWNNETQCLYDVIAGQTKDSKVRPNQIMAVSLSYSVIDKDKAEKIVHRVFKDLYTALGLRSLSPKDKEYIGVYEGDQYHRDMSYHEGIVWGWLLGQFFTAYRKVNGYSNESREICEKLYEPIKEHLRDAGVGSISEIFDGDEPLIPRGCFAQAWSVGEILRAYVEDVQGKGK